MIAHLFLVFPKIGAGDGGVLIGEIIAALLVAGYLLSRRPLVMDASLAALVSLGFYYFVLSNLHGYLQGTSPLVDIAYFTRFLLVIALSSVIFGYRGGVGYYRLIITPAIYVSLISLVLYVIYFLADPPSLGEILWSYRLGARFIPVFGLGLGGGGLSPIGGGSGNLYGTLCTAALLALNAARFDSATPISNRRYVTIAGLVLACALLTLSRSVFLTIGLILLVEFRKRMSAGAWLVSVALLAGLLVYFADDLAVFDRLLATFQDGNTDLSTSARLENYAAAYQAWLRSPATVLFGVGSNAQLLTGAIGAPLVESFFLGLLCSAGLLGIGLGLAYLYLLVAAARRSHTIMILLKFYAYQSVFQWTVGGGDFWGPVTLYVTAALFGLYYRERARLGVAALSTPAASRGAAS